MRMGYLALGLLVSAGAAVTAVAVSTYRSKEPVPLAFAEAGLWAPESIAPPRRSEATEFRLAPARLYEAPDILPPAHSAAAIADAPPPSIEPALTIWSREIASGETLDAVLAEAGLAAPDRAEIALALGAEYDLRRLRPGHLVTLASTTDGSPRRVELAVDDGVLIEVLFGERLTTQVVTRDPEIVTLAGEVVIESSIFAALDDAGIAARFAVDLTQMLGGTVDFRRELAGGEILRLLWREARLGEGTIGEPELAFASLELGGSIYEVVWPDGGSGRVTTYVDGEVLRVFAQPVDGARLSSVFGRRMHPVYGNVRMHTGVDFAAARGTPVHAAGSGRIAYIGRRGGYGRVVEITHGVDTITRYAHLSAVPDGLAVGDRVMAGDVIGRVGATGTATGPNLHYEVLVEGRPIDPLLDDRLAEVAEDTTALTRLSDARAMLAELLASDVARFATERL